MKYMLCQQNVISRRLHGSSGSCISFICFGDIAICHLVFLHEDLQSTSTTLYLQRLVGKLGKKADHFNFPCTEVFYPLLYVQY